MRDVGPTRYLTIAMVVLAACVLAVVLLALQQARDRTTALRALSSLIETRHGRVEYLAWGSGPAVLVIHGAGGGFDQGRLLARSFGADGFRWLAVSRFGYLRSSLPADPSVGAQAEAFAELLDSLRVERVRILAMSGGVPPALAFAAAYPERTERMVLLSSAPFAPFEADVEGRPIPTWMYSALLGNDVVYWTLSKVARGGLAEAFDARAELREGLPRREQIFVDELIDAFVPGSRRIAGVVNEAAAVDPGARIDLESVSAPVLVVHAKDDRINPYEIGAGIARRIRGAELVSLDTGGHLLLGHHAEVARRTRAFLAGAAEGDREPAD